MKISDWALKDIISLFRKDERGSFVIIGAVSLVVLVGLSGAAIDFARQQFARQRLSQAASLACQYARKTVQAVQETSEGREAVTEFFKSNLASQNIAPAGVTTELMFDKDAATAIIASHSMPTAFLGIFNIPTLNVAVTQQCWPYPPDLGSTVALRETFETPPSSGEVSRDCGRDCFQYVKGYNAWTTSGDAEGIEITGYKIAPPEGNRVGELVADRNVAISRKIFLGRGHYELRYFYTGGPYIPVPEYFASTAAGTTTFNNDPAPICHNNPAGVAWATRDNSRIGVYVSRDEPDFARNYLSASNNPTNPNWRPADLQEVCIYSRGWAERSIRIFIPASAEYWVSFAGQGRDAYLEGAQIDDIRLCFVACPGPQRLTPHQTPGHVVFREDFKAWGAEPAYQASFNQYGFSTGVPATNGWVPKGPNQFEIWSRPTGLLGTIAGNSFLMELSEYGRRTISRKLLLTPGYYVITYNYLSRPVFPSIPLNADPFYSGRYYCPGAEGNLNRILRTDSPDSEDIPISGDAPAAWHYPGVFLSIRFGASTTYETPFPGYIDNVRAGSVVVALDSDLSTTETSRPSQIIDRCTYASAWANRSKTVYIAQPGFYWLTFSSPPDAESRYGFGALITNLTVCAVVCSNSPELLPRFDLLQLGRDIPVIRP